MENRGIKRNTSKPVTGFFEYWESLGFFESLDAVLPKEFFILFEIARNIPGGDKTPDVYRALEEILERDNNHAPGGDAPAHLTRVERPAPVGDRMEFDKFKKFFEIKNSLPGELSLDDEVFDIKLLTKSLLIRRFYENREDKFLPVSSARNRDPNDLNGREQIIYLLLDRSRSMEKRGRFIYSKFIATEFLRRKIGTGAKIFYRPFDARPGGLFKIEGSVDYPRLIEKIMLTETGGSGTNMEKAILQAVSDMEYCKDMADGEILVITDCASAIDRYALEKKLGDIRLNIIKIGDEFIGSNYFEIKSALDKSNNKTDISDIKIYNIKEELKRLNSAGRPSREKEAYKLINTHMERIFQDLRDISHRFIEIDDFGEGQIFDINEEFIAGINSLAERIEEGVRESNDTDSKARIYKEAYFLSRYIEFLIAGSKSRLARMTPIHDRLSMLRRRLLSDPELLHMVMLNNDYPDDNGNIGHARREIRKRFRGMRHSRGLKNGAGKVDGERRFFISRGNLMLNPLRWLMNLIRKLFS